jgi:hypothetical protein
MIKFIIILFHILLFTTTLYISGHLKNDPANKKAFSVANREVIVKANKKVIAKSKTDKNGNFDISFNADSYDTRSFDFFVINKTDTLFLNSYKQFESDTPELTLFVKLK